MKNIAAIYEAFGRPSEVVFAKQTEVAAPAAGEVLVRFKRATINPSDLGMIGGSYGVLKTLPAVAGREGIGEVVELGAGVESAKVGDVVRLSAELGAWQQYQVLPASGLTVLPPNLDPNMAAMAFVNPPTALCILDNFETLQEGDWFIQNGAGSALGYFIIQLCKARGIRTVNMLRNAAAKRASLEELGADVVVDESEFDAKRISKLTEGRLKLGLNQIGGESVSNMIKAMGYGATVVTVGAMVSEPVRFPTRFLIFNDLRLRGFWWDKFQRTRPKAEVDAVLGRVYALIADGTLKAPVDSVFKLENVREALARAAQNSRSGKVVLEF